MHQISQQHSLCIAEKFSMGQFFDDYLFQLFAINFEVQALSPIIVILKLNFKVKTGQNPCSLKFYPSKFPVI